MKLFLLCVLSLAWAGQVLPPYTIGTSCEKDPSVNVTNLVVTPWPIYANQNYTFALSVTFTKAELLDQLTLGVKKGVTWHYTFFTINQEYAKGATATFQYSIAGPTSSGSYTDQITLHRPNYSTFACWQFDYVVN
ncbi:hypothetical protein SteCoe_26721 [Stentor coeruleus]|uniref:Reelin domain-containing protein n=1 Tax=Stentor coeruleus TaxID=5963 RepID=A0A1R2BC71_9CILI|nr:hypothetical protein SteCoe_26721 [Stentor coeruleus]